MLSRDEVRQLMPQTVEYVCDSYKEIRNECMKRIETLAQEGKECCTYVVPPFHFNVPVYDAQEVFNKLFQDLHLAGYQLVAWPESRRLLISWFVNEETAHSNYLQLRGHDVPP
jgi:hypothetical protein